MTAKRGTAERTVRERTESPLGRLRAMILMAGSLRSSRFHEAIQRSVLDLPMREGQSLLRVWEDQVAGLAEEIGEEELTVRILVDGKSPLPTISSASALVRMRVERDPLEYRGTAGVLQDVSRNYDDDDYMLVATATQPPTGRLTDQARRLAETRSDLSVLVPDDGVPSGLMLLRCGVLAEISRVGFVDLKEQALPAIAQTYSARVVRMKKPTTAPIRDCESYVAGVRAFHRSADPSAARAYGGFEERWKPAFSIVEDGALVDPSARICDSVVLSGARVAAKANVVRSVLGPGSAVRRGDLVLSEAMAGAPRRRSRMGGSTR